MKVLRQPTFSIVKFNNLNFTPQLPEEKNLGFPRDAKVTSMALMTTLLKAKHRSLQLLSLSVGTKDNQGEGRDS